jgi:hypothetical protein
MNRFALVMIVGSLLFTGTAAAQTSTQDCVIGVYADAAGTRNAITVPGPGDEARVYVLLWTEGRVDAVSYELAIPDLGEELFIVNAAYGPTGDGINLQVGSQDNVGLGECAAGFGGAAILVTEYRILFPFFSFTNRVIRLAEGDGGAAPQFSNCAGDVLACSVVASLGLFPVATESTSFSQIKSLY